MLDGKEVVGCLLIACREAAGFLDYAAMTLALDTSFAAAHRLKAKLDAAATSMVLEDLLPANIAAALTSEARQKRAASQPAGSRGTGGSGMVPTPGIRTQHGSGYNGGGSSGLSSAAADAEALEPSQMSSRQSGRPAFLPRQPFVPNLWADAADPVCYAGAADVASETRVSPIASQLEGSSDLQGASPRAAAELVERSPPSISTSSSALMEIHENVAILFVDIQGGWPLITAHLTLERHERAIGSRSCRVHQHVARPAPLGHHEPPERPLSRVR